MEFSFDVSQQKASMTAEKAAKSQRGNESSKWRLFAFNYFKLFGNNSRDLKSGREWGVKIVFGVCTREFIYRQMKKMLNGCSESLI